jgi:hypothetical protein
MGKRGSHWLAKNHLESKALGERFLADWLENNKTSEADIGELTRLCKKYRTQDPEDESMDGLDYILAVDDLLHVLPEGVDAHFCNLINDVLRDADLSRLRRCLSCQRWLFALHLRQKHCTPKCRDNFRMNTPEYRARKREDMQRLRKIEKERQKAQLAYSERELKERGISKQGLGKVH